MAKAQSEQFYVPLDVTQAHQYGSRTTFREADNVVRLGADVQPGDGADANSRMSLLACLAHELAHARRYRLGYNRPTEMPHCLLDEAETSVDASFFKILRPTDREDLVEDGRDRLNHWLYLKEEERKTRRQATQ